MRCPVGTAGPSSNRQLNSNGRVEQSSAHSPSNSTLTAIELSSAQVRRSPLKLQDQRSYAPSHNSTLMAIELSSARHNGQTDRQTRRAGAGAGRGLPRRGQKICKRPGMPHRSQAGADVRAGRAACVQQCAGQGRGSVPGGIRRPCAGNLHGHVPPSARQKNPAFESGGSPGLCVWILYNCT